MTITHDKRPRRRHPLENKAQIFYMVVRDKAVIPGLRIEFLQKGGKATPTVLIGGRVNEKGTASWNAVEVQIETAKNERPLMSMDRVYSGQFLKLKAEGREFKIRAPQPGENVVVVRTGFKPRKDVGVADDFFDILNEKGRIYPHGAFDFSMQSAGSGTKLLFNAKGADLSDTEEGKKLLGERLELAAQIRSFTGTAVARRGEEFSSRSNRHSNLLGINDVDHVVYYMPWGSILLAQDVEGTLVRAVSTPQGCKPVDAPPTLAKFFEDLRLAHDEQVKKLAEATPEALPAVQMVGPTSPVALSIDSSQDSEPVETPDPSNSQAAANTTPPGPVAPEKPKVPEKDRQLALRSGTRRSKQKPSTPPAVARAASADVGSAMASAFGKIDTDKLNALVVDNGGQGKEGGSGKVRTPRKRASGQNTAVAG